MKTYEEVVDALNDRKITLISNEYLGVKKQHDLQCQVCGHNWRITLGGAIKGTGCPKCSNRLKIGIEQAVVVAKERGFEVLSEDYIEGTTNSFMVKCDNGHIFRTNRHNFVNGGKGCAKCANNLPLSLDEKNTKLEKNGWRLLEDVPSVNAIGKLECTKCGGKKEANVSRYMKTYVLCRRCEPCDWERGFSPKLPAILYYLRISNGDQILYKLGITNRTVKDRFKKSELDNIEVLRELKFETGQQAHELEQYYLNLFSEYRYKGDPILKSGGNTEILTTDILGLDTLNQKPL
jgi:predicted nucleic acid-binding Zn ribbon protein